MSLANRPRRAPKQEPGGSEVASDMGAEGAQKREEANDASNTVTQDAVELQDVVSRGHQQEEE